MLAEVLQPLVKSGKPRDSRFFGRNQTTGSQQRNKGAQRRGVALMCEALILPLPKGDKLINTVRSQVAQGNVALDEPEVKRTNDREFVFDYFIGVSLALRRTYGLHHCGTADLPMVRWADYGRDIGGLGVAPPNCALQI